MKLVEVKKYSTYDNLILCDILKTSVKKDTHSEIEYYVGNDNTIYELHPTFRMDAICILYKRTYEKQHPKLEVRILDTLREHKNLPKELVVDIYEVKDKLSNTLIYYGLSFYITQNIAVFYFRAGLHEIQIRIHSTRHDKYELFIRNNNWCSECSNCYGDLGDVVDGYFRDFEDCLYLINKYLKDRKD